MWVYFGEQASSPMWEDYLQHDLNVCYNLSAVMANAAEMGD
jgi:hypothetical protein